MLFGETVAVCCENHTEHTNTLCGQNAEFWHIKACGTIATTGLSRAKTNSRPVSACGTGNAAALVPTGASQTGLVCARNGPSL
jgi:hypothetical protein